MATAAQGLGTLRTVAAAWGGYVRDRDAYEYGVADGGVPVHAKSGEAEEEEGDVWYDEFPPGVEDNEYNDEGADGVVRSRRALEYEISFLRKWMHTDARRPKKKPLKEKRPKEKPLKKPR